MFHLSPSVVCLQETHAVSNDDLLSWFSRFGYLCAGSFCTNHSCGVVVLYRSVLECRSVVCELDGRFVLVEFSLRGSVFRVASLYAPNRNPDRDAFFVCCIDSIDPAIPTLLCGDFNTVLGPVSQKSRNFTGRFRVSQFPLYLKNGEDLIRQTSQLFFFLLP